MLRALCLDLMDTLVADPWREAIEAATGLDLDIVRRLRDPQAWPDLELGLIDEDEFARRFLAGTDHRFDLDAYHEARRGGYRFLPGMEPLLDATRGLVERHVASNYPAFISDVVERFDLAARTEGVHASFTLGARKPDPRFYERLLTVVGHDPGACLFVDDRVANCEAAERAGMRAHHFDGADGLLRRLRAEGLPLEIDLAGSEACSGAP